MFLVVLLFVYGISCESHLGSRFFVSFKRSLDLSQEDAYILVVTDYRRIVLDVIFRSHQTPHMRRNVTLWTGQVRKISVKDFHKTGVWMHVTLEVNATRDFSVTVFLVNKLTRASYLALPADILTTKYRVVTFCSRNRCTCSIGTLTAHTHVTVHWKKGLGKIYVYYHKTLHENENGYIIDTDENDRDIIHLESNSDLSGLLITSNTPVSVVCGCVRNGEILTMEQMLPVSKLGKEFYPYPRLSEYQSSVKLVAHYNCTDVKINGKTVHLDEGESFLLNLTNNNKFNSSLPLLVAQLFWSNDKEGMIIVPAISQYMSQYRFPKHPKYKYTLYVGVFALTKFYITMNNINKSPLLLQSRNFLTQKDMDGITVDVECPIFKPCLSYTLRTEENGNAAVEYDIMTSPVGYNLSEEIQISEADLNRNRCNIYDDVIQQQTTQGMLGSANVDPVKSPHTIEHSSLLLQTTQRISSESHNTPEVTSLEQTTDATTITPTDLDDKLEIIRKELILDKKVLSATIRRKVSAQDDRMSSKGIGLVGVIILCAVFGLISLMDLPIVLSHIPLIWKKISHPRAPRCRRTSPHVRFKSK